MFIYTIIYCMKITIFLAEFSLVATTFILTCRDLEVFESLNVFVTATTSDWFKDSLRCSLFCVRNDLIGHCTKFFLAHIISWRGSLLVGSELGVPVRLHYLGLLPECEALVCGVTTVLSVEHTAPTLFFFAIIVFPFSFREIFCLVAFAFAVLVSTFPFAGFKELELLAMFTKFLYCRCAHIESF